MTWRIDDLLLPPKIGKTYSVPHSVQRWGEDRRIVVPVVIGKHSDRGVVMEVNPEKSPDGEHWHVDVRFLSDDAFDRLTDFSQLAQALIAYASLAEGPIIYLDKVCLRHWPEYKAGVTPEHHAFEELFTQSTLDPLHRCPHRGYPVGQVKCDHRGVRECPLHGLLWDTKGRLMRRKARFVHDALYDIEKAFKG